ncbi:encapsidation protein [Equine adenovirus 1]|uniref:Packaging protein 3 n=1 Tax=Equine adenovirus A serotype 1 TaxID=46916 RepID=G5CZ80_ADEE1|nr:late L1 protein [Equine adenovirus 1]AEP16411.1 late L1 protein [Equine adenovirus 1]ANG08556.1 encapsidation protein [Equine adenovirus 1]
MHPVLRQMKPAMPAGAAGERPEGESEGLVRLQGGATTEGHPRVQIKRDAAEAFVPRQNAFRDNEGEEGECGRHLRFEAGRALREGLSSDRMLTEADFEKSPRSGISPAQAHMRAADLVTAYEQTVKEEVNFQTSFNNNVRTLLSREEVAVGLMHLWDFVEAYLENPMSKALAAQLFLIVQHCRDEGVLRESLLNIAEPESRWLVDLINLLQTIVVQERRLGLSEKVAAVNYSVITLSKHYARKIFKSVFVPIDKEAKINTFYMRAVIKLLVLSDDLGMYRNERIERAVSNVRRREMSDRELMRGLRQALASAGAEEAPEEESPAEAAAPRSRATWGAGSGPGRGALRPAFAEEDEESDYDCEDEGPDTCMSFQQRNCLRHHHHHQSAPRQHERGGQPREGGGPADPVVGRRQLGRFY